MKTNGTEEDTGGTHRINFSTYEKTFLENLINVKYGTFIECKKLDDEANRRKSKAWEDLTVEFNSRNLNVERTVNQLKKCWLNIKTRRKSEKVFPDGNSHIDVHVDPPHELLYNEDQPAIASVVLTELAAEHSMEDNMDVSLPYVPNISETQKSNRGRKRNSRLLDNNQVTRHTAFNTLKVQRKKLENLDLRNAYKTSLHTKKLALTSLRSKLAEEELKKAAEERQKAEDERSLVALRRQHEEEWHQMRMEHERELHEMRKRRLMSGEAET